MSQRAARGCQSLQSLLDGLVVPVIAAPMLRVSGIELVSAACRAGIIGSFPTPNARTPEELESWLVRLDREEDEARGQGKPFGAYCPNLIMRRDPAHLMDAVSRFVAHGTRMVITSVGSPVPVLPALREGGVNVFADVASLRHAEKAVEAGVDGLVLLTAGSGGNTGWLNPFAFVRAVRAFWSGPLVLAGGLSDGAGLLAARVLGCTLGYMGTRFIATQESMATRRYKDMVVNSTLDDVQLTRAFTGMPSNILRPSIVEAGLDASALREVTTPVEAAETFGYKEAAARAGPVRWVDILSAGHSVSGVGDSPSVQAVVDRLARQYREACALAPAIAKSSSP